MRVWVLRRRESGAYLPEPVRVGGTPAPFELLVVEVTDQGKRRPSKVARLYAPGTKSIVAELAAVQLLWLKGFEFVLHGVDVTVGMRENLFRLGLRQIVVNQYDPKTGELAV